MTSRDVNTGNEFTGFTNNEQNEDIQSDYTKATNKSVYKNEQQTFNLPIIIQQSLQKKQGQTRKEDAQKANKRTEINIQEVKQQEKDTYELNENNQSKGLEDKIKQLNIEAVNIPVKKMTILEEVSECMVESLECNLEEDSNVIFTLMKPEFKFERRTISKENIQEAVRTFSIIPYRDECRAEQSNKDGGKECKDKKIKECLRGIGSEIIKQIGRKILSGSFNLTQISFPIRAMIPRSALEKALYSTCLFPLYINKAAQTKDLIERMKLLICATLGNFYINCGFLKPLNPILGETCEGCYPDGTRMYAEQITHHPPVSYFTVYGPEKTYVMYGNYNYKSNAGLNSLKLKNNGSRHIRFADGQTITYNFAKELYSGSFMGTMKVESTGTITFEDIKNHLQAVIKINSVKKKPTDFLSGTININGKPVSTCYGSYMGFIEFDQCRYWDYRHVLPFEPIILKTKLPSDHSLRPDKVFLLHGNISQAQIMKESLEELQRNDAKLRKKYQEKHKKKQ